MASTTYHPGTAHEPASRRNLDAAAGGFEQAWADREARLGDTLGNCCRPLPDNLRCCFISLRGVVVLLLIAQVLYGLLLIGLHLALLMPPFNQPRLKHFPTSAQWIEFLDLQFSLRIWEGSGHQWSNSFINEEEDVSVTESNYLGTTIGLVLGVITVIVAVFTMVKTDLSPCGCGKRTPWVEKSWLAFTCAQASWFIFCNIGKVITLCNTPSQATAVDTSASETKEASGEDDLVHYKDSSGGGYTWSVSHCGVLQTWYAEWLLLMAIVLILLLWAAFSYVNA
eukprot:CAMPEP_0178395940 /NCGR_PEP_ID=MMETSP0689_2-20121128/13475_1 /TAXON_ID=160604 /ORGANISM="Amphidinium massartii, Strain CS-259" /LENGTH=281 /DNA_ID=CAMNT_0020016605 /DNA_START=159 /DNA_END=1000 /DNA_ORIENTATION=+